MPRLLPFPLNISSDFSPPPSLALLLPLHLLIEFFLNLVPSGPPLDVTVIFRSSESLGISWKAPHKNLRNGELTGYQVCYSSSVINKNQNCLHIESSVLSYNIPKLYSSTKYFVTVAASTKIGFGNKSLAISKITNGGKWV